MGTIERWHATLPGRSIRSMALEKIGVLPGVPQWIRVLRHTYLSSARLRNLEALARTVRRHRIPGEFVECGVASGGSALLLALIIARCDPSRTLWLFDTFE